MSSLLHHLLTGQSGGWMALQILVWLGGTVFCGWALVAATGRREPRVRRNYASPAASQHVSADVRTHAKYLDN
jgi:hypothetical protein